MDPSPTPPQSGWTAILLAGQRRGTDPLAAQFGETYKALVRIGGRPMLARVLATLLATPEIARVVVLAQDAGTLRAAIGSDDLRVDWMDAQASISLSVLDVIERGAARWPILVTTADHPLLDPAIVAAFLGAVGDRDLAVGVVERRTIEAAHPGNRRTYLRFSDGAYSGANLFALATPRVASALRFWAIAEADRKRAWRLFAYAGPWLAFRAITRTIGFDAALAKLGRRLGLSAGAVVLACAQAAIDVDKPADWVLADAILRTREGR